MIRAGRLSKPCEFSRRVETRTATGASTYAWSPLAIVPFVWGELVAPKQREGVTDGQAMVSGTSWDLYIRFRDDLLATDRVTIEGRTYQIIGEPVDPDGSKEKLRLQLQYITAQQHE